MRYILTTTTTTIEAELDTILEWLKHNQDKSLTISTIHGTNCWRQNVVDFLRRITMR